MLQIDYFQNVDGQFRDWLAQGIDKAKINPHADNALRHYSKRDRSKISKHWLPVMVTTWSSQALETITLCFQHSEFEYSQIPLLLQCSIEDFMIWISVGHELHDGTESSFQSYATLILARVGEISFRTYGDSCAHIFESFTNTYRAT